ncbi:hypothetical protein ACOMHN_015659 [Nucella lapillus]
MRGGRCPLPTAGLDVAGGKAGPSAGGGCVKAHCDAVIECRAMERGADHATQSVQSPRTAAALGGRWAVVQDAKFHDMFIHIILEPRGRVG